MTWKLEAVSRGCVDAARQIGAQPWLKEFYLAGGTALALKYGHRLSVDLDFFSSTNPLGFAQRQPVLETLSRLKGEIEEETDGTVHARLNGTHLSFFRYRYPLLRGLQAWEGCRIAHPIDIGLMKVGAIIGRGSRKDFVDLYVILRNDITLPRLLKASTRKFPGHRDFTLQAFRALVYFADAEKEPPLRMRQNISWIEVKRFLQTEVRALAAPYR